MMTRSKKRKLELENDHETDQSCFGKKSKSSSKSKDDSKKPKAKGGKKGKKDGFDPIPDVDGLHVKCRCTDPSKPFVYETVDDNDIKRAYVPDTNVLWSVDWPEYAPVDFTQPSILKDKPVWADPEDPKGIKFNQVDGKINRVSFMGNYELDTEGRPINPKGRTGLRQRGKLGKWGPNHAADPIVTRWKHDDKGKIIKHETTKKPILQFVAIERKDTGEWAIPGGMCDPGENVSLTLKREFMEEAKNSLQLSEAQKKEEEQKMDKIFKNGKEIYKGYVDDPRNTDNAWMETQAYNFHDDDGKTFDHTLTAGDDAVKVKWMDIGSEIKLYASHKDFIQKVAESHKAHW